VPNTQQALVQQALVQQQLLAQQALLKNALWNQSCLQASAFAQAPPQPYASHQRIEVAQTPMSLNNQEVTSQQVSNVSSQVLYTGGAQQNSKTSLYHPHLSTIVEGDEKIEEGSDRPSIEIARLNSRIEYLKRKNLQLKEDKARLEKDNNYLKDTPSRYSKRIKDLNRKNSAFYRENRRLRTDMERYRKKYTDLKKSYTELQQNYDKLNKRGWRQLAPRYHQREESREYRNRSQH
jgi:chromosome segregation ATPase